MEQRIWSHIEELQAITTVVHSLESRLSAVNQDHEAEKQKLTQGVDKFSNFIYFIFLKILDQLLRSAVNLLCFCAFIFLQLKWEFSEELKKFQEQMQHQLDQAEET